jgi:hypothetical protein
LVEVKVRHGKYDKADFFKGILEKLRMELNSLHAKRKRVGKKWYWDLKPD